MKNSLLVLIVIVMTLFLCLTAQARENLVNRVGVGYNNQLNFQFFGGEDASITDVFLGAQTVSAKYWFDEKLGIEPLFGYFTAKNKDIGGWASEIAVKVPYNLIVDEHVSFYTGGGLGIVPMRIDYGRKTKSDTGFLAMAFVGFEFFIPNLEKVAFDAEFGLQYIDVDTYAQISTYGGGFGVLGIRYYF
jgi:hypothetical protein